MAAESTSYTPAELFAGEASKRRRAVTVKSGQDLAANTVVMFDADGKIVAHDGVITASLAQSGTTPFAATLTNGNPVAGVLIAAVDADGADAAGMIYCDGDFIGSLLVWPATIDGAAVTNLLKQKMFVGTELFATFYTAGETA